jgi:hypothetical protein
MKNITLAIDEKVLKQARAYAARSGTTLSALVRDHLARLVGEQRKIEEARHGMLELIDMSNRPARFQLQMESGGALCRSIASSTRTFSCTPRREEKMSHARQPLPAS